LMSQSREFAPMGDDEAAKGAGGRWRGEVLAPSGEQALSPARPFWPAGFCCTSPSPSMTPPLNILLAVPSSEVNCERAPALDLDPLPVGTCCCPAGVRSVPPGGSPVAGSCGSGPEFLPSADFASLRPRLAAFRYCGRLAGFLNAGPAGGAQISEKCDGGHILRTIVATKMTEPQRIATGAAGDLRWRANA
jgi:hypothetical protein